MRLLLADAPFAAGPAPGAVLHDGDLAALYAVPPGSSWLRANFAASLDGAATGADGRSGSVNTAADEVVFELVRALSDVVVVGAGTVRAEGYGPLAVDDRWSAVRAAQALARTLPLVVVSASAVLPAALTAAGQDAPGTVLLATHAGSDGLEAARALLGAANVLVCGGDALDPGDLRDQLSARGWERVLVEGGPHLFGSFLQAGVVDELCLSLTPHILGGDGGRITATPARDDPFVPRVLVEQDGTVMGRWLRRQPPDGPA